MNGLSQQHLLTCFRPYFKVNFGKYGTLVQIIMVTVQITDGLITRTSIPACHISTEGCFFLKEWMARVLHTSPLICSLNSETPILLLYLFINNTNHTHCIPCPLQLSCLRHLNLCWCCQYHIRQQRRLGSEVKVSLPHPEG